MYMNFRLTNKINITENTRHPPHILIFNIGGVSPLHHPHAQQVFSGLHIRAEIKLGAQTAAFAKAYIVAIYINFKVGFYAVEFNNDLAL